MASESSRLIQKAFARDMVFVWGCKFPTCNGLQPTRKGGPVLGQLVAFGLAGQFCSVLELQLASLFHFGIRRLRNTLMRPRGLLASELTAIRRTDHSFVSNRFRSLPLQRPDRRDHHGQGPAKRKRHARRSNALSP